MNKKYLIPMLVLFGIGIVAAGAYLVASFTITADVMEPFSDIQYVVIGDSSNWDGITGCDAEGLSWQPIADIDVQGMYAGESRNVCLKFYNAAEAGVGYIVGSNVLNTDEETKEKCENAFPVVDLTGTANPTTYTFVGRDFKVADDAPTVNDCRIQIGLSRGSED